MTGKQQAVWMKRYEVADDLARSGPGRSFVAEVVAEGGPYPVGTRVQCRAVAGDESVIHRLEAEHRRLVEVDSATVCVAREFAIIKRRRGPVFFAAAELVEGRLLSDVLREVGQFPDALTEGVAVALSTALDLLHARGVARIGLFPGRVLVEPDGRVRLLDPAFGPAVEARWPKEGRIPASLRCAAPELLTAIGGADARADLYSMGAVLYRTATGAWHRRQRDAAALRQMSILPLARRPRAFKSRCSLLLDRLIGSLLEPSPDARLPSAGALLEILEHRRESTWWQDLDPESEPVPSDTTGSEEDTAELLSTPTIPGPVGPADPAWLLSRLERAGTLGRHPARCVGRDVDLRHMWESLDRVVRGSGSVVVVEGEPGVGKTRLVDAFVERIEDLAPTGRPVVLSGEYDRLGIGRPMRAFSDALARLIGEDGIVAASEVARLMGDAVGVAEGFAAVLNGEMPPVRPLALTRESLLGAFARAIRHLAAERPVILVVENVQWIEPEGADLFGYLARVVPTLPLLIVATHRPVHHGSPASYLLTAVRAMDHAVTLKLDPLPPKHTVGLVRELLGPGQQAEQAGRFLVDSTNGVPFLVVQTLRCLQAEGALDSPPDVLARAIPQGEFAVLERRLAELTPMERRVVEAAAVQGVTFDARVVRAVLEERPATIRTAVGQLVERGMMAGSGRDCRFTSHAFFDHVHDGIGETLLETLHDATARAHLARPRRESDRDDGRAPGSGMRAYRVAWHSLMAGRTRRGLLHVRAALRYLRETWRLGEAERLALLAARKVPTRHPGHHARMVDLMLSRADILSLQGRRAEERQVLDDALALARGAEDRVREARVLLQSTRYYLDIGRHKRAKREGRDALALANRCGETLVASRAHALLGRVAFLEMRFQQAREHLKRVVDLAREHEDPVTEAAALQSLGTISQEVGSVAHALELQEEALRIYRRSGDLMHEAEALESIAAIAVEEADFEAAEMHLRRALAIHRSLADGYGEARVLADLGALLQDRGALAEAIPLLELCLAASRDVGLPDAEVASMLSLAHAYYRLGRLDDARRRYGEAMRSAREIADPRLEGYALSGLGEVSRQQGDTEVAAHLFDRAVNVLEASSDADARGAALLGAGRVALMAGDTLQAHDLLLKATAESGSRKLRVVNSLARAYLGLTYARQGRGAAAERELARAVGALEDVPGATEARLELAFVHSLVLRVLRQPVEADGIVLRTESALRKSLADLEEEDRDRLLADVTPYREIVASARAALKRSGGSAWMDDGEREDH